MTDEVKITVVATGFDQAIAEPAMRFHPQLATPVAGQWFSRVWETVQVAAVYPARARGNRSFTDCSTFETPAPSEFGGYSAQVEAQDPYDRPAYLREERKDEASRPVLHSLATSNASSCEQSVRATGSKRV